MHRYVALRKKLLGLDEVHMYDLYAPLVDDVDAKSLSKKQKKPWKKPLLSWAKNTPTPSTTA